MEAIVKETREIIDVELTSIGFDNIKYYHSKDGTVYSEKDLVQNPLIIRDKGMMVYEVARDLLRWNLHEPNGANLEEIVSQCTSLAKKFVEQLDL